MHEWDSGETDYYWFDVDDTELNHFTGWTEEVQQQYESDLDLEYELAQHDAYEEGLRWPEGW